MESAEPVPPPGIAKGATISGGNFEKQSAGLPDRALYHCRRPDKARGANLPVALSWPAANLFRTAWSDLTLFDVQRFLDGASGDEHEGLTWEAKAGRIRPEHIHRSVSAFANSILGGYLILGAERADSRQPWTTPGCAIPGDEPRLWIAQAAGELINAPTIDSHAWDVGDGKWVAVVAISPSSVPPVIAPSGVVYERVTGASPPIKDPTRLAAIFARGDAARDRAVNVAREVQSAIEFPQGHLVANVRMGLAATGTPSDTRLTLFTERTQSALEAAVLRGASPHYPSRADTSGTAYSLRCERVVHNHDGGPVVEVNLSGGVGAAFRDSSEREDVGEMSKNPWRLVELWRAAHDALSAIGAYGPAFMVLYVHGLTGAAHYQGWTRGEGPTADEVATLVRHIQRHRGAIVHEGHA